MRFLSAVVNDRSVAIPVPSAQLVAGSGNAHLKRALSPGDLAMIQPHLLAENLFDDGDDVVFSDEIYGLAETSGSRWRFDAMLRIVIN